jgi:hypothetical protein
MYDLEIETRHVLQRYPRGGVAPLRCDLERYNRLERERERVTTAFLTSSPQLGWGAVARAVIQAVRGRARQSLSNAKSGSGRD